MEFTDEQQSHINKLVGEARKEGREKGIEEGKKEAAATIDELRSTIAELEETAADAESLQGEVDKANEALGEYAALIEKELEALPEAVKKVLAALPGEKLSPLEKLSFARELDITSEPSPTTPIKPKSKDGDEGYPRVTL